MDVADAIETRVTCRAYLPTPIPVDTIRAILGAARRTPSGGNLQPWRVWAVSGEDLERLKTLIRQKVACGVLADGSTEYAVFPEVLKEPYASRRFQNGEVVYGALGLSGDDHVGRYRQALRNYEFFGAPAALFFTIDRSLKPGQWADMGMFMQSVMLLAREHGLHTAALESWAYWPRTVAAFLGMPDELMLFRGMALGHMDPDQPVNRLRVPRAPLEELVTFVGC